MPETIRPSEIDRHKREAHDNRGYREKFPENHEVVKLLIVVNVNRNDHHHCGGRYAHEKGEVRDIDSPGDFVAHSSDYQTMNELLGVRVESEEANCGQGAHPRVISPVAHEGDSRAAPEKDEVVANRSDHTSK